MRRIAWLLLFTLLVAGCAGARPVRSVSLHETAPTGSVAAEANPQTTPIRIAAASIISPQETIRSYGLFFAYLENRVGQPLELVQRVTYEETYDLLRYGTLDLALVCTYVYVLLHKEIGLEVLAAPEVNGRAEYYSFIIVRADSGITRFDQLEGRRFAFTDPLSSSGRIYPLSLLRQKGLDPGGFFASTTFTHSHDNSIKAVVQGLVDGAAVDSLVYDQWVRLNPDLGLLLKVIDRSVAMPSPPFVASLRIAPHVRNAFRAELMRMHEDPEGRKILDALGIDRFVPQADAQYEPVRNYARQAGMLP